MAGSLSGAIQSGTGFKLTFRTKQLAEDVGKGFHKAFKQVAPQIAAEIKGLAPVDTGRLQSSVSVRAVQGADPRLEISTVGYGFFVENGTSKMAAQPFIMPVVLNKKWVRQITRIAKAIQRGG